MNNNSCDNTITKKKLPPECHPHFCLFDSPACPDKCECICKRLQSNCVSVTAQEALNIPELQIKRSKTGILLEGTCTRERIFGIPYDPTKDFAIEVPKTDVEEYLRSNFGDIESKYIKNYIRHTCCYKVCTCSKGSDCRCRSSTIKPKHCI